MDVLERLKTQYRSFSLRRTAALLAMALSVALYRCHYDFDECDSPRHKWLLKVKYIPDIIIKLIGMALSAFVYPPAMVYSVLLAMLWMFVPVEKIYDAKHKG